MKGWPLEKIHGCAAAVELALVRVACLVAMTFCRAAEWPPVAVSHGIEYWPPASAFEQLLARLVSSKHRSYPSTKPSAASNHGGASTCCQPAEATLTTFLDNYCHYRAGRAHCRYRPDCSDFIWTTQINRPGLVCTSAALYLSCRWILDAFVQCVCLTMKREAIHNY